MLPFVNIRATDGRIQGSNYSESGLVAMLHQLPRYPTRVYPGGPRASAPLENNRSRH